LTIGFGYISGKAAHSLPSSDEEGFTTKAVTEGEKSFKYIKAESVEKVDTLKA